MLLHFLDVVRFNFLCMMGILTLISNFLVYTANLIDLIHLSAFLFTVYLSILFIITFTYNFPTKSFLFSNLLSSSGSFCEAPEVQTLEMLLQAFDEEDAEGAIRALNSPFIKSMDVEYTILARDMRLPQGIAVRTKVAVRENAAASYVSPNAQTTATVEVSTRIKVIGTIAKNTGCS